MSEQDLRTSKPNLIDEAREWYDQLVATNVAGRSILKQLIDRLDVPPVPPLAAIPVTVLREHWLTGVECDHETRTDVATCFCGKWRSDPWPNIPAAVNAWIEHLLEQRVPAETAEAQKPDAFKAQKLLPFETRWFESPGMAEALGYEVIATYKRLPASENEQP